MNISERFPEAAIPARAGVGLKSRHYEEILETRPDIGWFEVHPENYMGEGGPPHRYLGAIRELYPLSLHGVGLSIGAARPLDRDHLKRLKHLERTYRPALFSEHLAWSTHDEGFLNDLLPVPYTHETLDRVCEHVDEVQETVGRRMLLENPSTYVRFCESEMDEIAFLSEIARRTGCGLLLDVNNVHVSATNHGYAPEAYIDAFPVEHVGEIHLGGHAPEIDDLGQPLLIDAHDREVDRLVWELYARTIRRTGALPTLVEWDTNVPEWPVLFSEAREAERLMGEAGAERRADAASLAEPAHA